MFLVATLLTIALSLDSASAGFAYGTGKTRVPFLNIFVMAVIDTVILAVALLVGASISRIIPAYITLIISCVILIAMGLYKLVMWVKNKRSKTPVKECAKISWRETFIVGIALSIDGLAVGVGVAMTHITTLFIVIVIAFSMLTDILIFSLGYLLGKQIHKITKLDVSWISGIVFILIALQKIFF